MDSVNTPPCNGLLYEDTEALFDDSVIKKMNFTHCSFMKKGQSYPTPGAGLIARPLSRSDYDKGFIELLSQLTKVGDYTKERFETQFDSMKMLPGMYYVIVIEDPAVKLVASASLLIEHKFIHGAALRGRIEDVVVDKDHRSLHLGSYLLELLTELSKELGCYKITLDCKPGVEGFYEKCAYTNEGQMFLSRRFRE